MFKSTKKAIATAISIIVLVSSIVPILNVSGVDTEEALKNDLISAWQILAADSKETVDIIARPSSNWSENPPVAITSDTTVDGLDDISVLGDTYYEKMPISGIGWSKQYNFVKSDSASPLTDYNKIKVYMCGYTSSGSVTKVKIATQVNSANTNYTEFTGWNYANIAKASGGIKFIIESATNLSALSVGCVIGTKTVSGAPLPENYADLSLVSLVSKATLVDYTNFSSGENFKAALIAAKKFISANQNSVALNNLISAWTKLSQEKITISDTVAYPLPADRITAEPSIMETYGLTEEEYNELGGYYACIDITSVPGGNIIFKNVNGTDGIDIKGYDKITVFVKTMDENYNEANGCLTFQVNSASDGSTTSYPWPKTLSPKWNYTITNTGFYKDYFTGAKTLNNLKFQKNSGCKYVLVGAFVGTKTVAGPSLPDDYDDMTLAELVIEARKVSAEGFDCAKEFEDALKEAEEAAGTELAKIDLISAWTKLAKERLTVNDTVAYPLPSVRQEVDPSIKETYSLSDAEYNKLGGYYACVDITSAPGGNILFRNENGADGIDIKGYDKITVFVKTMDENYNEANGCLTFQVNSASDGSTTSYPWPKTLSPKWNYTITNTGSYKDYFTGAKTLNNLKFQKNSGCKYVLVGAFVGTKSVSATPVPKNYDEMSIAELVIEAKKVSTEGFENAVEFETALKAAEVAAGPELSRIALISAWTELAKEQVTISKPVAYPLPSVRQEVDPSIKSTYSLSDTDYNKLGGYYACVDLTKVSGGNILFRNENGADGIDIKGYDKITVFVKTMDENYNETNGCLTFQVNSASDGSITSYPWPKTLSPKWNYTITNTGSYKDYFTGAKTLNNLKFQKNKDCTNVLVGVFVGYKTISGAPLPTDYNDMSLAKLVMAAKNVEYTPFSSGVAFKEALDSAQTSLSSDKNALKEMLVSVWEDLQKESKVVVENIAYPLPEVRKNASSSIKATYGLSDAQFESLGGYYAIVDITTASNGDLFFKNENGEDGISLKGYDKATVFVKTLDEEYQEANGCLRFQINEALDGSRTLYPWPKSLTEKWIYNITSTGTYADYFTGQKTANNLKFQKDSGFKYLLVGVFRGYKTVMAEPLPENYELLELEDLVNAAKTIDYKGFESSNLFAEVLKTALASVDVSEIYYDDLIETFNSLAVDKPGDLTDLYFDDLVAVASKVDTSTPETALFKEKLDACIQLLNDRKQAVADNLAALGLSLPEGSDTLNTVDFVDAVLSLDIDSIDGDKAELSKSISSLYSLTETGVAVKKLTTVLGKITTLPYNSGLLKAADLITLAEQLDLSETDDVLKNAFSTALNNLKDVLTKGKADKTALQGLVNKAEKMNMLDFTDKSVQGFKEAFKNAGNVLTNIERKKQSDVDKSVAELLDTWGLLEVYNRTMWIDFLEYYTGENPEATHNSERGSFSYSAEKITALHNGVNTALKVTEQPSGWHPINHNGIELENLKEYQYFEFYFKASPETFKGNALTFQLQALNGVEWYNVTVPINSSKICGEWCRVELPLNNFSKVKNEQPDSLKLSGDGGFRTYRVRVMAEGGTNNSYEISSIVAVSVSNASAGVVPTIAKLVIKDRAQEEAKIPRNPFTGVDRGDPWGDEERKNASKAVNIVKQTGNSENIEETDDNDYYEEDDSDIDYDEETEEQEIIAEGTCGKDLIWKLTKEGELIISGKGKMDDFEEETAWEEYLSDILKVTIEDGVTAIGEGAFYGCKSLNDVTIPDSVTEIGAYAFYDCNDLSKLTVSKNVTKIGDAAIGYVYDEKNESLAKVSPFTLLVEGGSKAHEYAKKYGIKYTLISGTESDLNGKLSDNTTGNAGSFNWIVILGIAAGVIVIGTGAFFLVFVLKKKKANRN